MTSDFTATVDPISLFAEWLKRGGSDRTERSERDGARHRGRRRLAQCPHGAAQGLRRRRLRLLHQFRERQGPRTRRPPQGRALLSLEEPRPPGARARPGGAGHARRGRRLFRDPRARQPDRRLGEPAVAAAGIALRAGEGGGGLHGEVCRRRNSAARRTGRAFALARSRSSSGRAGTFRLHDRVASRGAGEGWEKTRLYP